MRFKAGLTGLLLLPTVITSIQDQPISLQERIKADWQKTKNEGDGAFQKAIDDQITLNKDYFLVDKWSGEPGYQPPGLLELVNEDGEKYIMEIVDPSEEKNYDRSETFTYSFEFDDGEKGAVLIGGRNQLRSYEQLDKRMNTAKEKLKETDEGIEKLTWAFGLGEAKKYGADGFSVKATKIMEHVELNPYASEYIISSYSIPEVTLHFKDKK